MRSRLEVRSRARLCTFNENAAHDAFHRSAAMITESAEEIKKTSNRDVVYVTSERYVTMWFKQNGAEYGALVLVIPAI